MISKFYTLKGSRESRKGRRRKTSEVKICKKTRKKAKEKYGACLRHLFLAKYLVIDKFLFFKILYTLFAQPSLFSCKLFAQLCMKFYSL